MIKIKESGYLDYDALENGDTYEDLKQIVNDQKIELEQVIMTKESELKNLYLKLSALEYELRTSWLLFDFDTDKGGVYPKKKDNAQI